MSNTDLTADTITNAQIDALRGEAATAGDRDMVDICLMAVGRSPLQGSMREVSGGAEMVFVPNVTHTQYGARDACAQAINDCRSAAAEATGDLRTYDAIASESNRIAGVRS